MPRSGARSLQVGQPCDFFPANSMHQGWLLGNQLLPPPSLNPPGALGPAAPMGGPFPFQLGIGHAIPLASCMDLSQPVCRVTASANEQNPWSKDSARSLRRWNSPTRHPSPLLLSQNLHLGPFPVSQFIPVPCSSTHRNGSWAVPPTPLPTGHLSAPRWAVVQTLHLSHAHGASVQSQRLRVHLNITGGGLCFSWVQVCWFSAFEHQFSLVTRERPEAIGGSDEGFPHPADVSSVCAGGPSIPLALFLAHVPPIDACSRTGWFSQTSKLRPLPGSQVSSLGRHFAFHLKVDHGVVTPSGVMPLCHPSGFAPA